MTTITKKLQYAMFGNAPVSPEAASVAVPATPAEEPAQYMLSLWMPFAERSWRRVLRESLETGDIQRADYARGILLKVLGVDPATIS